MNNNQADHTILIRPLMIAIDEVTRARPVEVRTVIASLGSVAAAIVHTHAGEPDSGADYAGEFIISRSYREALAALQTPTEAAPAQPLKRGRRAGKR